LSIKVASAIWEGSHLEGSQLLVMQALAWYADDAGYCWPSVDSLAKMCRLSERSIRYILKEIEATGELVIERGVGRNNVSHYWIKVQSAAPINIEEKVQSGVENLQPIAPIDETEKVQPDVQKVQSQVEKVQVEVIKGATHCTRSVIEPSGTVKEPSVGAKRPKPAPIDDDFKAAMTTEYGPLIGGEHKARDAIERALNHKAYDKAKDKRLYLKLWLKRDADEYATKRSNGNGAPKELYPHIPYVKDDGIELTPPPPKR
jgi:hypothetical protein